MKKLRPLRAFTIGAMLALSASTITWAKGSPEPKVNGSLPVRDASQIDYPKLAKISASEASRIANAEVPGSVLSVGLENEDGFLIYAVEVAGTRSGRHEVIVDAGNGKVISAVAKNGNKNEDDGEDGEQDDD